MTGKGAARGDGSRPLGPPFPPGERASSFEALGTPFCLNKRSCFPYIFPKINNYKAVLSSYSYAPTSTQRFGTREVFYKIQR